MTRKTTNSQAIDQHIGYRIRLFRLKRGLTQHDLSKQLGISYQQLHKYENGSNSVSASRMAEISSALGISIASLFHGFEDADANSDIEVTTLGREQLRLMRYIAKIEDPQQREALTTLLQSLSVASHDEDNSH